mmetsp:Transcript_18301/g.51254  ORF Transcript_18301/g.51254 Transcript_18301/m.51254 type:complete len:156 (+) Transcript_18301:340-807(+)|eukprot:CAMPEP_0117661292 /NCGR_PEP_ID=MMETSP0804-20121206/7459_1 /TAXON_ID=1074897 /ORGANISM="Tetraselmis astigmatica, Strain CCMP880" /LENGTH=155 /DNA_ID=CAMNT_0005468149 /DNA_START=320 /DNA_END=787 /DNA_ORIENTATION=-
MHGIPPTTQHFSDQVGDIALHALKGEAVAPVAIPTATVQLTAWAWNGDERSMKKNEAVAILQQMDDIYNSKGKYPDERPIDEAKVTQAVQLLVKGLQKCKTLSDFKDALDAAGDENNIRVDKWVRTQLSPDNKQVSEAHFDNCLVLLTTAFGSEM